MAVLYPNEIINVYIQDVEFTGNIVSVGNDGNYSYDYSNPMQATQSEPSGSLILIYPGTYSMGNLYNSVSNKDSYWRGMGDDVTDVYLRQTLDYGVVLFMGSYNKIILENFRTFGNFDHSELNFNNGTTSTNIYLNKLHLNASAGFGSGYAGVNIVNGSGNIYGTNVDINANVFQLRGLGWQTTSSYYSFTFMRYYEAYSCTFCNKAPDVHTYVTTSLNGYGYQYGNFLIDFNRPSPEPPQPPIAIYYQNVWQVGDYIYHTVSSGIDVYNDNASSIIHHISLANPTAVWADESYVYIGTTNSGVYRSTSSGSASPYKQNPSITSDQTMYLHGSGDNLCVSTRNGVDRFDLQTGDRIYTTVSGVRKCFQTTSGTVYYIEASQFYELDLAALGGVVRDWNYYQVIDFDATPFDDANVGVVLPDTFPFYNTTSTGVDLRFISNNNEVLAYYIQSWYPTASAEGYQDCI